MYYHFFLLLHKSGRNRRWICKGLMYILRRVCRPNHRNLLARFLNCHGVRSQLRESCLSLEDQVRYLERGLVTGWSLAGLVLHPWTSTFICLIFVVITFIHVAGPLSHLPPSCWVWPSFMGCSVMIVKNCRSSRLDFFYCGWKGGLILRVDRQVPQKPSP